VAYHLCEQRLCCCPATGPSLLRQGFVLVRTHSHIASLEPLEHGVLISLGSHMWDRGSSLLLSASLSSRRLRRRDSWGSFSGAGSSRHGGRG
jgi:hypothetical protein